MHVSARACCPGREWWVSRRSVLRCSSVDSAEEGFLRTFYQNLANRPLEPEEAWYVPLDWDSASNTDPVKRLARGIEWTPRESVQLLSGVRGTGKSTELRRLRRLL